MYLTAANSIANIIHQGGLHCNQPKEMVGGGELGPLLVNNAEDSPTFTTSENTYRAQDATPPTSAQGVG